MVHQVQLVHQAAFLEQFQRPVHRHAIEFGIFFARQLIQALGIQMLAGLIDQVEQDLALPREPHALLFERIFDAGTAMEETISRVPQPSRDRRAATATEPRPEGAGFNSPSWTRD